MIVIMKLDYRFIIQIFQICNAIDLQINHYPNLFAYNSFT